MLLSTAINRIKNAGHDIADEYSEERCVEFLNNAIQQASALLIAARYPALVQETIVRNGDTLPKNFSVALGTYPLRMTGGRAEIIDDDYESVKLRYFATPSLIVYGDDDELPFTHDAINEAVVRAAVILALNENEYDISQDSALLQAFQQAVAASMTESV